MIYRILVAVPLSLNPSFFISRRFFSINCLDWIGFDVLFLNNFASSFGVIFLVSDFFFLLSHVGTDSTSPQGGNQCPCLLQLQFNSTGYKFYAKYIHNNLNCFLLFVRLIGTKKKLERSHRHQVGGKKV